MLKQHVNHQLQRWLLIMLILCCWLYLDIYHPCIEVVLIFSWQENNTSISQNVEL